VPQVVGAIASFAESRAGACHTTQFRTVLKRQITEYAGSVFG